MSPDEIIAQLARVQPRIPSEALLAADGCRTELTPRLLASLVEVIAQPALLETDRDIELPFYAMYLLAAWREKNAHPLLLAFLRLPGEQAVELSGDIVTQDMDRLLAQTCGGEPAGLCSLTADARVNEWARCAALKALTLLVMWDELPRAGVIAHFRSLIAAAAPPPSLDKPEVFLAEVVCSALEMEAIELRDELLGLFDRGWIDEMIVPREDVVAELDQPRVRDSKTPIDDVAEAIRWWGCFQRDYRTSTPKPAELPIDELPAERLPFRAPPKVGRNEPCPCGSGKKFKKCCGA